MGNLGLNREHGEIGVIPEQPLRHLRAVEGIGSVSTAAELSVAYTHADDLPSVTSYDSMLAAD